MVRDIFCMLTECGCTRLENYYKKQAEKKWARRAIPKPIAFVFAIFHPKLTVEQLRKTWGKWTDFDCQDMEEKLQIKRIQRKKPS